MYYFNIVFGRNTKVIYKQIEIIFCVVFQFINRNTEIYF